MLTYCTPVALVPRRLGPLTKSLLGLFPTVFSGCTALERHSYTAGHQVSSVAMPLAVTAGLYNERLWFVAAALAALQSGSLPATEQPVGQH